MRRLSFIVAKFQLLIVASHIPGNDNKAADALSRDRLIDFRSFITQAQEQPSSIPVEWLDFLVITKPDWTSLAWTRLWTSTVWQLGGLMIQLNVATCPFVRRQI